MRIDDGTVEVRKEVAAEREREDRLRCGDTVVVRLGNSARV